VKLLLENWREYLKENEKTASSFEKMKEGEPTSFVGYYWATPKNADKLIKLWNDRQLKTTGKFQGLFVSDEPESWGSPWMGADSQTLLELNIQLNNPFIISEDPEGLESQLENNRYINALKAEGYDSVISIPATEMFTRQALIFNPNEQIKSINIVNDLEESYKRRRDRLNI